MPKISASGQDYLEAILALSGEDGSVRSVDVATALKVSRASVNKAMGVLKSGGYLEQEKYGNIRLTPKGIAAAHAVQKRHDLLTEFLVQVLEVPAAVAMEDACRMEHSISPETLEKLEAFLKGRRG